MALAPKKPDPLYKAILLITNAVNWLLLCVQLLRRWHAMPSSLHFSVIYLYEGRVARTINPEKTLGAPSRGVCVWG